MILLSTMRTKLRSHLPHSPRAKRTWAGVAFLFGSVLVSASIFATGPHAAPDERVEKAWPVSTQTITPAELSPMFTAFGRIESAQTAKIQTDLVARVRHVPVREGDWVEAGDLLVQLDDVELALLVDERNAELARERAHLKSVQNDFALARSTTSNYKQVYDAAQKKLTRHQDLFAKRMIAQSLLDEVVQQASAASIDYQRHVRALENFPNLVAEARAGVERAQALAERAQIDLAHATIRAPFAGPVLAVMVSPGMHVALGMPLVEVADAESFEIRAQVPESHRELLRRHLAAGAPIVAHWEGRDVSLRRLAANVRTGQSGLDAFFTIQPAVARRAEVGRVVRLEVVLPPEAAVVALPVQSIYENDRIYAVEGDRLKALTVERIGDHLTADGEHRVLVRSPELRDGQRIVTTQLPKAISGLKVQPVS